MSDGVEANLVLTRQGYELWNAGGAEAMAEHFWAPDVVLYASPEAPDRGIWRGAEEVVARMHEFIEAMGHIQVRVRSLEGRGEWVLAALDASLVGSVSGAPVAASYFQVLRWGAGRVREIRSFLDADQARCEYERLAGIPSG